MNPLFNEQDSFVESFEFINDGLGVKVGWFKLVGGQKLPQSISTDQAPQNTVLDCLKQIAGIARSMGQLADDWQGFTVKAVKFAYKFEESGELDKLDCQITGRKIVSDDKEIALKFPKFRVRLGQGDEDDGYYTKEQSLTLHNLREALTGFIKGDRAQTEMELETV